jgi:hypothetical protein
LTRKTLVALRLFLASLDKKRKKVRGDTFVVQKPSEKSLALRSGENCGPVADPPAALRLSWPASSASRAASNTDARVRRKYAGEKSVE